MADYLRECMESMQNPPIDFLQKNFCIHCAERKCERSGLNNSAFDIRVKTWQDRLFLKVPRADPEDPSYSNIRARSFSQGRQSPVAEKTTVSVPVTVSSPGVPIAAMPKPSGFVDIREAPETSEAATDSAPDEAEESREDSEIREEPPAAPLAPPAPLPPGSPDSLAANTPFQQGMMIGGAQKAPEQRSESRENSEPSQGVTFVLDDD